MRTAFSVLVQFALFLLTFLVGSLFLHPFGLRTVLVSDAAHTRVFLWDGVLLMLLLYALVLGLEAATRRLRDAAAWSTLALAAAAGAGLALKFGFLTVER